MTAFRTSRNMQEQVRFLFSQGYKIRRISKMLGLSRNTVRAILRATDEGEKNQTKKSEKRAWAEAIDWQRIIDEHAKRSTPIKTLHREFAPEVSYMAFYREFRRHYPRTPEVSIRLIHEPGERIYFDFCDGIAIVDKATGKVTKTQLFVACLPFSSYTEAESVLDQKQPTLIRAIENAFARIGGVSRYAVVDNLKSAVTRAHLYDPDTNRTVEFSNHMGFVVLPARPYKPRDMGWPQFDRTRCLC